MKRALHWLARHPFVIVPFALYAATAHRTIGLPDSAVSIEAMSAPVLSAVAYNHSLHNLVGWLLQHILPVGDAVWRSSLAAAFYGGVAIGLFYVILLHLGATRRWAAGCASVFMVSHSMWWHATTPENYALSLLFAEIVLLLALREGQAPCEDPGRLRRLAGMCFAAGLSLLNHLQNGVLCVAAMFVVFQAVPRMGRHQSRILVSCLSAGAMGAAPFLFLVLREMAGSPDAGQSLAWLSGGGFVTLMFRYDWDALTRLGHWLLLQFPSPFLILLPLGVAWSLRLPGLSEATPPSSLSVTRPYRMALWIWCGATLFFFAGYTTWDQFSFYLPLFAGLALMGSEALLRMVAASSARRRRWIGAMLGVSIALPPLVYPMIRYCAERGEGPWGRRYGAIAAQYAGRYDLVGMLTDPAGHDRGTIDRFVRRLLDRLPPGAVFVDDMSTYYQVEFVRRRGNLRPDLTVEVVAGGPMSDFAATPESLAEKWSGSTNRIFVVTDGGLTGRFADLLTAAGRARQRFDLGGGLSIIECARRPID